MVWEPNLLSPSIVAFVLLELEGVEACPAVWPADRKRLEEGGLRGLEVAATLTLAAARDCDGLLRCITYIRCAKPQTCLVW